MTDGLSIPADIRPVEPAYRHALRLQALVRWLFLLIPAVAVDRLLLGETRFAQVLPFVVGAIALAAIIVGPGRVYARLGYAIDGRLLRVLRGWLFHSDTIVPFVRVQHIDVTRAPIDKLFGLARRVVHTAGTHNSIVVLPGLTPATAADIRDRIRAEIHGDWE